MLSSFYGEPEDKYLFEDKNINNHREIMDKQGKYPIYL